jgi:hypothetical protein
MTSTKKNPPPGGVSLFDIVTSGNDETGAAAESPASTVTPVTPQPPATPFLIADIEAYFERLRSRDVESVPLSEHQAAYGRAVESRAAIEAELNKLKVAELLERYHVYGIKKKTELVTMIANYQIERFLLGADLRYSQWSEDGAKTRAEAVRQVMEAQTQETLDEWRRALWAKQDAEHKALTNPETIAEFKKCIRHRGLQALRRDKPRLPDKNEVEAFIWRLGERELTDEELERYDELRAAEGAERRTQQMIERATIRRISIGEGNYMEIVKHWHGRRECWQWIVVLAEREDRTTFDELCIAANKLGGGYQRAYAPANSPGGFAFDDEAQAEKFVQLQSRDVFEMARLERLIARRDRVRSNAVTHFETLAERMDERAEESLTRPRLLNTERRLMLAERAYDHAHADQAMAGTLRAHAEALAQRLARHTDRIRWRTHAEAFNDILARAGGVMARVEYPWPEVGVHTLSSIAQEIGDRDGSIMISQRIMRMVRDEARDHVVRFDYDRATDTLRHFYRRARLHRVRSWALDAVREAMGHFKRLRLMGLDTLPELRAALREHLGRRVESAEWTRAEKVMRDLYGGQFPPDYFPTPRDVVELMLEYADMQDGLTWLEPSAGGGHIVGVVQELYPNARPTLVEISGLLVKALAAQGYAYTHADFLQQRPEVLGTFDRVIANVPFGCDGVGTDIDHVRHAYTFLNDSGRLTSLMSEGVFYRGDNKAQEFRAWLEMVGGESFELPEGAFLNGDRPTSWAARIVVIDKLKGVDAESLSPDVETS